MTPANAIVELRKHLTDDGKSFLLADAVRVFNEFYFFVQIDAPPETNDSLNFSAGKMESEFGMRPMIMLSRSLGISAIINISLTYPIGLRQLFLAREHEHCHSHFDAPTFFQSVYTSRWYTRLQRTRALKCEITLIESDEIGEKIDQMGLMEILEGKP